MTWTFRAVLALLRGAVVSWLAFSFSAVAGFSLVLCLGHIDCGQWRLEGGRPCSGFALGLSIFAACLFWSTGFSLFCLVAGPFSAVAGLSLDRNRV